MGRLLLAAIVALVFSSSAVANEWPKDEKSAMVEGCVADHVDMGIAEGASKEACQCMADQSEKAFTINQSYQISEMVQAGDLEAIKIITDLAAPCYSLLQ